MQTEFTAPAVETLAKRIVAPSRALARFSLCLNGLLCCGVLALALASADRATGGSRSGPDQATSGAGLGVASRGDALPPIDKINVVPERADRAIAAAEGQRGLPAGEAGPRSRPVAELRTSAAVTARELAKGLAAARPSALPTADVPDSGMPATRRGQSQTVSSSGALRGSVAVPGADPDGGLRPAEAGRAASALAQPPASGELLPHRPELTLKLAEQANVASGALVPSPVAKPAEIVVPPVRRVAPKKPSKSVPRKASKAKASSGRKSSGRPATRGKKK